MGKFQAGDDPADHTNAEVVEFLTGDDCTPDEYDRVMDAERSNRNRVGILNGTGTEEASEPEQEPAADPEPAPEPEPDDADPEPNPLQMQPAEPQKTQTPAQALALALERSKVYRTHPGNPDEAAAVTADSE